MIFPPKFWWPILNSSTKFHGSSQNIENVSWPILWYVCQGILIKKCARSHNRWFSIQEWVILKVPTSNRYIKLNFSLSIFILKCRVYLFHSRIAHPFAQEIFEGPPKLVEMISWPIHIPSGPPYSSYFMTGPLLHVMNDAVKFLKDIYIYEMKNLVWRKPSYLKELLKL